MEIRYKKELYPKSVLFQACYRFTDNAYIHLDCDDEDYIVTITAKEADDDRDYPSLFSNQMIEESAREDIRNQTNNIRQILFARSMASTVIFDEENDEEDMIANDKSAMKDWFDNE